MKLSDFFGYKSRYLNEVAENMRLRAHVEMLEAERQALVEKLQAAHDRHIATHERFTDFLAKRTGVGTVFGPYESVPDVPPVEMPDTPRRMTGRELADMGKASFIEELENRIKASTARGAVNGQYEPTA